MALAFATPASAGPPFQTDDPAPTDYRHFEIYAFAAGEDARDGQSGAAGVDFNYGAAPDLQLTAVLPVNYERPNGGRFSSGLGNIELAAKYRVLHQESFGWDVAVFPRVFLPAGSHFGDRHASFLLPIWVGKDLGAWSTFGGGGCALNQGGDSQNYCQAGWALTRKLGPDLHLGAELFHQTPDVKGARAATTLGLGATYDVGANLHLLAYGGAGLQNRDETGRSSWYTSLLFTF